MPPAHSAPRASLRRFIIAAGLGLGLLLLVPALLIAYVATCWSWYGDGRLSAALICAPSDLYHVPLVGEWTALRYSGGALDGNSPGYDELRYQTNAAPADVERITREYLRENGIVEGTGPEEYDIRVTVGIGHTEVVVGREYW